MNFSEKAGPYVFRIGKNIFLIIFYKETLLTTGILLAVQNVENIDSFLYFPNFKTSVSTSVNVSQPYSQ